MFVLLGHNYTNTMTTPNYWLMQYLTTPIIVDITHASVTSYPRPETYTNKYNMVSKTL